MNEPNFIDADSEFKSENNSFKDLIMRHLERIAIRSCCEVYHGGHYEDRISNGVIQRVWVPDGKDVYSNAVQAFSDMLFAYYDEPMLKAEKRLKEQLTAERNALIREDDQGGSFMPAESMQPFGLTRYDIYTQLLRELCSFLKRKQYLDVGTLED